MQNLLQRLFGLDRREKRALQVTFDALMVPFAFLSAFYMRMETIEFIFNRDTYIGILISFASIFVVYTSTGFYNSITRHSSIETARSISVGCAISCAALFTSILLLELQIPRSVPLIFAVVLSVISLGTRLLVRSVSQSFTKANKENVAIYGASAAGIQLMEALRQSPDYQVRFFIDDSPDLYGKNLDGVRIYSLEHAKKKFEAFAVQTLLLAIPGNSDATRRRVFDLLPSYPLKIKSIPSISDLISGAAAITDFRDLKVEDLLGREPVHCNADLMAKTTSNKSVLVTGAGGSIGSELCQQIIKLNPKQLIILDVSEFAVYTLLELLKTLQANEETEVIPVIGSVQDKHFLKKVFDRFPVDTTYHAAAYKHVPLMEQNVMQCIANNAFGTRNMAEIAISRKVKNFILVSTDKAVRPTNFMGASKRLAEIICQTLTLTKPGTCFAIVRFGNVLGSSGSVVPLFKKQIERGGPITLTHPEISRYFMTITEAAQLVIQAGSLAKGGEVFVLDMGEPIKIIDLVEKMVALSGLKLVWNSSECLKSNEIRLTISGLRPGEKLFEELSYNEDLVKTIHQRINTTSEKPMLKEELEWLLNSIETCLDSGNHQKLFKIMGSMSGGNFDIKSCTDNFIEKKHNRRKG